MKDKSMNNMNVSFAEYYSIDTTEYVDEPVTVLPFSVRIINRFMGNSITTIAEMLNSSPEKLLKIKGFGVNCLDEIKNYCLEIQSGNTIIRHPTPHTKTNYKVAKVFRENSELISMGDYSFAEDIILSDEETEQLRRYKEASDVLDEELVFDCVNAPEKVQPLIEMFSEYQDSMRRYLEISELLSFVPNIRKKRLAYGFINAFTVDDKERELLYNQCQSDKQTLESMILNSNLDEDSVYVLVKKFTKWCSFDLKAEIESLFNKLYLNEKTQFVIQMRSQHKTLEEIGNTLGITRERVRQIEAKTKRNFNKLHSRVRVISKIAAERNGDTVLTTAEIEEYCNANADELIFLLQSYDSINYNYDKELDVFIVGDESLQERVQAYIETLPDIIPSSDFLTILEEAQEEENIPSEMLEKAFLDAYKVTGDVYHRSRLSLSKIYNNILEKYYSNGIKAYESEEIKNFRTLIKNEYGDVGLPTNNRALTARISDICILCGRGVYRPKKKQYITNDLLQKIYRYIIDSDNSIFLTNTIFCVFEKELLEQGVNNKYYLQGILHEAFGEKFIFRRDYISKDNKVTSIISAIINFIKKSNYPVDKKEIYEAFPGITEVVISFATSDPYVLNLFGKYIHGTSLNITDKNKDYLYNLIERHIANGRIIHYKELFDYISNDDPDLLNKIFVNIPTSLFSVLEYLFKDKFQFKRPFIAKYGIEIEDPAEKFKDYILGKDELVISDITAFARENHYEIYSILDELNSFNDTHLIANKNQFARINFIGITEEIAKETVNILANEVKDCKLIVQLECVHKLPKINIPWSEWLIYSVVLKWSTELVVGTTSNQFKLSTPVIAPRGELCMEKFESVEIDKISPMAQIDDLDNIDDLISDYIEIEFNEELL